MLQCLCTAVSAASAYRNGYVMIVQVVEHFIHDLGCHGGPPPPCIPAAGLGLGHPSSSCRRLFHLVTQSKLPAGSQVTLHCCSSSHPSCCVCWLCFFFCFLPPHRILLNLWQSFCCEIARQVARSACCDLNSPVTFYFKMASTVLQLPLKYQNLQRKVLIHDALHASCNNY